MFANENAVFSRKECWPPRRCRWEPDRGQVSRNPCTGIAMYGEPALPARLHPSSLRQPRRAHRRPDRHRGDGQFRQASTPHIPRRLGAVATRLPGLRIASRSILARAVHGSTACSPNRWRVAEDHFLGRVHPAPRGAVFPMAARSRSPKCDLVLTRRSAPYGHPRYLRLPGRGVEGTRRCDGRGPCA